MNGQEYNTMNSIIDDLSVDDIEQLEDYAADCAMLCARKTARYIRNQIRHEADVLISLIRVKLVEDYTGV